MRTFIAAALIVFCAPAFAQFLNPDPDAPLFTGGNFGHETVQGAGGLNTPGATSCPAGVPNGQPPGSVHFGCFGFLEQWNDLYVSPNGPFWSISAQIYGVNGPGCCRSTDYNLFPVAPVLVYATPTTNQVPGYCGSARCSPYQWDVVVDANGNPVPVKDESGNPVKFYPVGPLYTVTAGTSKVSGYHQWAMNANIPTCVLDASGQACALDVNGNPTLLHYAVDFEGLGATGSGGEVPVSRYLFIRGAQTPPAPPSP